MAGTTTYYGISYPTNTDYVKDGATAMQTIADGFDSAVAIPTYNNQTGTSYTFVLADAGKTVTSNNASAVTFTIPPQASVAWANNTTLTVRNLGAGVVTIAGGSGVTVTNTAQTVAQYGEVKLIRTASNAWTVVPASGGASGLTLVSATNFTAQSTIQINNCFTSTYDNYYLDFTLSTIASTTSISAQLSNGGTPNSSSVYNVQGSSGYQSSLANFETSGTTSWGLFNPNASVLTDVFTISMSINRPAIADKTIGFYSLQGIDTSAPARWYQNRIAFRHDNDTAYDGIRFTMGANSGTLYIYGYSK